MFWLEHDLVSNFFVSLSLQSYISEIKWTEWEKIRQTSAQQEIIYVINAANTSQNLHGYAQAWWYSRNHRAGIRGGLY